MDLGLTGKRALVLASSRGLGLGIARALAAEGATVLLVGRNRERLEAASAEINRMTHGKADFCVADSGQGAAATDAIATNAEQRMGGFDILVHNMGGPPAGAARSVPIERWRSQIDAMLLPVFTLTSRFLPAMKASRWGRILTVASSGVVQPIPNLAISNTLRSAPVGWNKTLAAEVAPDGITANVILPGRIETDRVRELDTLAAKREGKSVDEIERASRAMIPIGRYGTVEEFGTVGAFLCSASASYVTGTPVRVDGGLIRSI